MTTVTRRCPGCGKAFLPLDNSSYRPFCSERCQLIDLGDWLTEKHRIKGEQLPIAQTDSEEAS
jgi:uncharacterized protein